uniref:Major facilitator superfamily (MFS) profile domain-containing protein n=1 Tax=Heliothis virescens TaxID=7102 RepID=A0A2A4J523_HELVI
MASPYTSFIFIGLLDMLSVHFVLPYLDDHMKELGFNHIQIGLVGAAFYASQMISSPIIGSISDVKGRKPVLLFCLIVTSFAYFWLGITSSFYVFFSLRIVLGIFKQTQILTRTIAPDYLDDPNDVSILYGKLLSLGKLGTDLGTNLGGRITKAFPKNGFTIACALTTPLYFIVLRLVNGLPELFNEKKEDNSEPEKKSPKLYDSITDTYKQSINNIYSIDWNKYWDIFLFKLILSTSIGLYYSNFSSFLETHHETSAGYHGYIGTCQGIISTIILETVSYSNKVYRNDTDYSQRIFHVFLVIVLSFVGLALVPNIYLYAALVVPKAMYFSLGRMVTLNVLWSRSEESNRGALIGLLHNVGALSSVVTPLISGVINHYLGVSFVFYTGAILASVGLVLSYQARSRSLEEKIK